MQQKPPICYIGSDMIGILNPDVKLQVGDFLYTAPQTKPLSDEEIQNIWYQHEKWLATVPLSFARAIEERHGIKSAEVLK